MRTVCFAHVAKKLIEIETGRGEESTRPLCVIVNNFRWNVVAPPRVSLVSAAAAAAVVIMYSSKCVGGWKVDGRRSFEGVPRLGMEREAISSFGTGGMHG